MYVRERVCVCVCECVCEKGFETMMGMRPHVAIESHRRKVDFFFRNE